MIFFTLLVALQPQPSDGKSPSWSGAIETTIDSNEPLTLSGRAWLDSPGGQIPFDIELVLPSAARQGEGWIINGTERIKISHSVGQFPSFHHVVSVKQGGEDPTLITIDHYDAVLTGVARTANHTVSVDGEWRKRRGPNEWAKLPFHALLQLGPMSVRPPSQTFVPSPIEGRWAVKFSTSDDPAVAIFKSVTHRGISGTFLTTTGDYGYLAGEYDGTNLSLSCFDGAHAFLFKATMQADGTLAGDFWSGDRHHETWTAKRDENAALPDAFTLTKANDKFEISNLKSQISDLKFPDLDGNIKSLADPAFAGKARLIHVFGSWCPNCHDEAAYLSELSKRYKDRSLSIIGLAFELTGDAKRDADQVRKYAARHGIHYPLLVAGLSAKDKASEALPLVDKIRAYPTTIFMHADGRIRAVHTGFSGPATGEAYDQLRSKFEEIVEELLLEKSHKATQPRSHEGK